ncbi:MAG TPA: biopolymer transporter ExbD [Bacteroidia bacterium]|nr:biopolymer transporter ExbD [Sphingobacteriales bacterium]HPD65046.1 biopolymer transporter ExbD [Bacteroidia bacterium]HRS58080.1 biopolymer transporter ExbD [Bacteroidia bacterium]HRU66900.1 biopolymer transporter ExbD [Bacteroidia bacterium]
MAIKRTTDIKPDFNMASMTDIIFLLLIFFLLSSNFVTPNAIKLILPKATTEKLPVKIVNLSVTENLQYYIDNEQVSYDQIENKLRSMVSDIQDISIVLRVDERVRHGDFVKVLKSCNKVTSRVVIATMPE